MAHITIEYIIMLPVLILQILLFPLATSWLMNVWVDSRRTLALQEVASHIGSSIQQVYFALNHATVTAKIVTQKVDVPPFIENYPYTGNATLKSVLDPELNSSKVLEITFRLVDVGTTVKTMVILGGNVVWRESTFVSNSTNACITAEKFANGTIRLSFGG
jgi:ribosomal protein RSM22 (predicted rRNA methylase)